jgi:hypothetical protein
LIRLHIKNKKHFDIYRFFLAPIVEVQLPIGRQNNITFYTNGS